MRCREVKFWLYRLKIREGSRSFQAVFQLLPARQWQRTITWKDGDGRKHTFIVILMATRLRLGNRPNQAIVRRAEDRGPDFWRIYLKRQKGARRSDLESTRAQGVNGRFAPKNRQLQAQIEAYPWNDDEFLRQIRQLRLACRTTDPLDPALAQRHDPPRSV